MAGDQQNGSNNEQYSGEDFSDRNGSAEQSQNGSTPELDQRIQEAVNQALAEELAK